MVKTIILATLVTLSSNLFANSVLNAERAIANGAPLEQYRHFQGHPLYPYLQYRSYRDNLSTTPATKIVTLLKQYPDAPFAGWLAEHAFPLWLASGQYDAIIDAFNPNFADESIECEYRLALLQRGQHSKASANISDLWLSPRSIESACDPLFAQLIHQNRINQDLIIERFILAMQANNPGIGRHLSQYLQGSSLSAANTWLAIERGSQPLAQALNLQHAQLRSALLGKAIHNHARQTPDSAYNTATTALNNHLFINDKDQALAFNQLTRVLASKDDSRTLSAWQAIPKGEHDDNTIYDFIAYQLRRHNWQQLATSLTTSLGIDAQNKAEVLYWIGKAFEKTNQSAKAQQYYQRAASKRDFFGFLAAEKLGQNYQMNDAPIRYNRSIAHRVLSRPEAYRSRTWSRLGDNTRARQEYQALIKHLSPEELKQAAYFAHQQNWTLQTITSLSKIKYWDALTLRFPTQHQNKIYQLAKQHRLSPATIYAIIRKESIFQPQIKSPAGAIGLMQVMPATASATARKYGIPYSGSAQLSDINTNLTIGSQYLHDRLQEFGHLAYAAAAYNAGPSRAHRWLGEHPGQPLDEWIAQIPFNETRDYVKRVLEYEKVYEYLLQIPHRPIHSAQFRAY